MTELLEENLILLISQPRAGSTLLQRILAGHPDVHTTAEPWLMLHPAYALRNEGHEAEYNARIAYRALQDFLSTLEGGREHYFRALQRMALHLYRTACEQAGKTHFLDKTPRYYSILPELARIFPEARFVILLRNPLAVLASILNTWVKGDWTQLSRFYRDLMDAPALLLEGIQLLDDRATVIHYEDLVVDPVTQVAALCTRLGLEFYPEMLDYGQNAAPPGLLGDRAGVQRHTRPSTASLERWLDLGRKGQTRRFALEYLEALGSYLLAGLGYDHTELEATLLAVPCTQRGPTVSWERATAPSTSFWDKLYLIAIESVQQWRPLHSGKQLARLLADDCERSTN